MGLWVDGFTGACQALDGEVKKPTYALEVTTAYPDRYFEMYIAEQQMVAVATGLAVRGPALRVIH